MGAGDMTHQELFNAAIERGETYEAAGANKASGSDIRQYIIEIASENGVKIDIEELAHEFNFDQNAALSQRQQSQWSIRPKRSIT